MGVTRREVLQGAAALSLASSLSSEVHAKENLTVLEFPKPYVDASKRLAEKWDKTDINWAVHVGGGAAALGKIKAVWPNSPYDLIGEWSAVFPAMIKEGWLEAVTLTDVPNLAGVPERFLAKDDNGNIKSIPRSINGGFFAVRTDRCPIEIKAIEDLLNPKLKSQISWPLPTTYSNMATVTLALGRGGNEFNMDPGWKFLEELAKSGNIGRVYHSAVQNQNAMTTGEISISYVGTDSLTAVANRVPMKALTKVDPSLKAAQYVEGWVVMANSKNKKDAMEFANFMVSKENAELFNELTGGVPANQKAKASAGAAPLQYTPEEHDKFAYLPDWAYMSTQLNDWVKKFEQDIVPKI
ncbi:ABC transporter substrate-binding protein [Bradyrhizobium elkanii]|uniref:ABC transporter substrate-binding protein n=1 Tax=Bradyrhizobium elkanii TaxID=29448 RepID=UPI000841C80D|nr:extracellular solute-binding protein [Bradyrhizobium elkanii]